MSEEGDHVPHALPHTWQVTSDSIAARWAVRLSARVRLLLRSALLGDGMDRAAAARSGLVDPWFPIAARPIERVLYGNLRGLDCEGRVLPPCYKPAEGSSRTLLLRAFGKNERAVGTCRTPDGRPPHPPFGLLLPRGEKGTERPPALRAERRGAHPRSPSPQRGEGWGEGDGAGVCAVNSRILVILSERSYRYRRWLVRCR